MRAAAKLDRRSGLHDADQIAVLFAGHPHRAGLLRFLKRQHARYQMCVVANHLINAMRNGAALLVAQRAARPTKIEAHPIDTHPGSSLIDLVAKNVFERPLQQMRRRMMTANLPPPPIEDAFARRVRRFECVPSSTTPRWAMASPMYCVSRTSNDALWSYDAPAVADLAAALCIERRAIQHKRAFLAGVQMPKPYRLSCSIATISPSPSSPSS